ncbi:hypothetical protein ES707_12240 [subsurface metagenome]
MSYYFGKTVETSFEETLERVASALQEEGFGVLTEIDVQETLKKKLNVDFRKYRILGACNPPFAYRALQAEDKIGVLLPCNVIVQETTEGSVEVSAMDPAEAMAMIENADLKDVAEQVRGKLQRVIDSL